MKSEQRLQLMSCDVRSIRKKSHSNLLNNIAENNTIGMTQFKSIKKPKIKFPMRAPPRPNVSDKAAAITL